MKQIFQNLKSGVAEQIELPTPVCPPGCVLIQTSCSLISPGTERMIADFGKAGWIAKARKQPDKVKLVLQKIRTDGVEATFRSVFAKLDQPLPVGYCNVGRILEVGSGVRSLRVGDRVVSNGYHAELVTVPENLCARIPDSVSDEAAAFTVLGAIGLQGVRLAAPTLGETFVVYGLGLIGVLIAQLLQANGVKVIGLDVSQARVDFAKKFGITGVVVEGERDPTDAVLQANGGQEVDGVLIAASTPSNQPISFSPRFTRKRGRIILVGVVGLELERTEFFKKEITFQVSCSYGPGRYDEGYERDGLDYPIEYVRWTENRNFQAVLDLLSSQKLHVHDLITERVPFIEAAREYERLLHLPESYGFVFEYEKTPPAREKVIHLVPQDEGRAQGQAAAGGVACIGAGNYARGMLLPAFQKAGAKFSGLITQSGINGADLARKYGFLLHATDNVFAFQDEKTSAVVIATRHDSHAELVLDALQAGKHVFVEKPLCLKFEELEAIRRSIESRKDQVLMVGFNRRYAPLSVLMREKVKACREPIAFQMTINAGAVPAEHWTQKENVGGGRIIGELCHFIDYAYFLTGSSAKESSVMTLKNGKSGDTLSVSLSFQDGSVGTINYFANGHKSVPKEFLQVFVSGRVLELNNFRSLKAFGFSRFSGKRMFRQDKGQVEMAKEFLTFRRDEQTLQSMLSSMETTLQLAEMARS